MGDQGGFVFLSLGHFGLVRYASPAGGGIVRGLINNKQLNFFDYVRY